MSTGWPAVPLGEVLTHCKDFIESPEDRMYPKLSVRLYGKGVVIDAPADGATLKMKRHQLARAGQVILSEIWGKKRAIGFVPLEGEGALCTSHFFLFDVNEEQLYRGWLAAVFRTNYLAVQLGAQAFGTTGYAAVRPNDLLAASIPLPRFPSSGGSWRRSSSWPARSKMQRGCGTMRSRKPRPCCVAVCGGHSRMSCNVKSFR